MPTDHLRSQTPGSLATLWPDLPLDPSIARRVIARVTGEGRDDLVGLRGLSHALAAEIGRRGSTKRLVAIDRRESALDGFVKYLFRAEDGALFETVRIPLHRPRFSVCVSSQAGCGLGCVFCETGRLGFTRNLEPWEIVEQVLAVKRDAPSDRPVTGCVFQGQGEPLQNYDAVIRAAVGAATVTFTNGNAATFSYQVNDGINSVTQTKSITRQVFRAPGTACH